MKMGKALAVLLLTATMATPIAAQAQAWQGRGGERNADRQDARDWRDRARPERSRPQASPAADPAMDRRAPNGDRRWAGRDGDGRMTPRPAPQPRPEARPPVATPPLNESWRDRDASRWNRDRRDDARQTDRRWDNGRWNDNRRWNNDGRDNHGWDRDRWNRERQSDRRWDNDNRRGGDRWNRDRGDRRSNDGRWNEGRNDWRWNDRDRDRWDRDWRRDNRYDWQRYRSANRYIYRAPRYYPPRGYGYDYRRWSYGYRLPAYFYGQSYWIDDPFYYRLPPAYGPYRWVRYYDDVLLVDITNGLIQDIIYSFFWR